MKPLRPLPKRNREARQIWRVVDGAVQDAVTSHPEFFALGRQRNARQSITKRVAGAIAGYLAQTRKGRSGARSSGG